MALVLGNDSFNKKRNRHSTGKNGFGKISAEPLKKRSKNSLKLADIFEKIKELVKRYENLHCCYLDGKTVVVDITTGSKEDVESLIQMEIGDDFEHIRLDQYAESPKYVTSRGEDKIESGSCLLKIQPEDAEKYNQFLSEILEGKTTSTLGYFASEKKSRKKYILTAMHFISEEEGKQEGTCPIYATTKLDGNLYAVSEKFFGWLGSYDISESIKDMFIDIVALELKDDAPLSKLDYTYKDEKLQAKQLIVPDDLDDSSRGCQVQKWGQKTGLTFGEIVSTDCYRQNGSGQIRIKCLRNDDITEFGLKGDSGSLVTDVLESTKFKQYYDKSCSHSLNPNAYGILSCTIDGEGIGFAANLQFGLRMLQMEFDLDLELCNPHKMN